MNAYERLRADSFEKPLTDAIYERFVGSEGRDDIVDVAEGTQGQPSFMFVFDAIQETT